VNDAGKVAVVTGVGAGSLGEATATSLRERGFRVLTSTRTCATSADAHALELTDRASVEEFARWVDAGSNRLDVLVNNAGVHLDLRSAWHEPHLVDGAEVHWRTNYLGTAQLTRLLIPLLLTTAAAHGEARVVNVVSKLHARGRNDGLDGHLTPYDSWTAYGTSKLALVHEAHEIERRYGARGLHGYSVHPGAVATRIADRGLETAPILGRLRKVAAPLERRVLKRPVQGARTIVFCATSPDAEPGGYHRASAPSAASEDAQDEEAGRILWDNTTRWVERG
jgi:NAD(P)-dependent dehydrogenase (short-subunit alcohol dehydrogenase family)